jgi:hypothetical protein
MLAGFYERMGVAVVFWLRGVAAAWVPYFAGLRVSTVKSSDVWLYIATKLANSQESS